MICVYIDQREVIQVTGTRPLSMALGICGAANDPQSCPVGCSLPAFQRQPGIRSLSPYHQLAILLKVAPK